MADNYLVQRRKARGLSQSELSRKSRIGQGTLSEIENGKRALSLQDAKALSPHLSVKSSELFARQIKSRAAVKSENAKRGPLHSAIAQVEELLDQADSDDEKKALQATIDELESLLDEKRGKPSSEDTAEKSQRRSARQGRDAFGRRRREEDRADIGRDTATKSAARDSEGRKRDGFGRRR